MSSENTPDSVNPWDAIFREKGRYFTGSHPDLYKIVIDLKGRGAKTILDVGCGTGRHVVYFARHEFDVTGFDASPEALRQAESWLNDAKVKARLDQHNMLQPLPYDDAQFDALVSIQAAHHGRKAQIEGLVAEIARVVKDDGFIFITVPSARNQAEAFEQIEPNTYIPLDGMEKGLPHHYFTPESLTTMFHQFRVTDIHIDDAQHYCLSAYRLPRAA